MTLKQINPGQGSQNSLEVARDERPLAFLYPAETLILFQRPYTFSLYKLRRKRRNRVVLDVKRHHFAMASAKVPPADNRRWPISSVFSVNESEDGLTPSAHLSAGSIPSWGHLSGESLSSATVKDFDKLWRLHETDEGTMSKNEIIHHLSESPRRIDVERLQNVFDATDYAARLPITYSAAIKAALRLDKVQKAVDIHHEALARQFQAPFGTDTLFAYAIESKRWLHAFDLWRTYWREIQPAQIRYPHPHLWDEVKRLPTLVHQALSLAEYAIKLSAKAKQKLERSSLEQFVSFTSGVMRTALFTADNPSDGPMILRLMQYLKVLGIDKEEYYEKAIMHCFQVRMTSIGLEIYDQLRQKAVSKHPSRRMLHAILAAYFDADNVDGIQAVLDDWTRFFNGPDQRTYRRAIDYFGLHGDATIVEGLLEGYSSMYGPPQEPRVLAPLLLAYARRGEVNKVIGFFKRITSDFRMEPSIVCWNILLSAYTRAEDGFGASRCFDKIRNQPGLVADRYTFGTLIHSCARRGDLDGIWELLEMADNQGIKLTTNLYDGLILGYINNGDVDHAEHLLEEALTMNLEGSYTKMWNYVLHARAFQRRLEDVVRIHRRMQEAGVRSDHLTYASLMQAFIMVKDISSAAEILETVMPRNNVKVTALHYAVLMAGHLRANRPETVLKIFERMLELGLKPNMNTNVAIFKASISVSQKVQGLQGSSEEKQTPSQILEQVLAGTDAGEVAGPDPLLWMEGRTVSTAYPGAYYDSLIFIYGQEAAFEKVKSLYESYLKFSESRGRDEVVTPPFKMLNALMASLLHDGDYQGIERCWQLAAVEAANRARKWNSSDTSKAGWVAPATKYLLAYPLSQYLRALAAQQKISEMKDAVKQFLWDGYSLDKSNWNLYIELLVMHGQYEDAFKLCESHLMEGWIGWPRRRNHVRAALLKADLLSTPLRPFYRTLVHLARVVTDLQSLEVAVKYEDQTLTRIAAECPATMEAIQTMPSRDDAVQSEILRRT